MNPWTKLNYLQIRSILAVSIMLSALIPLIVIIVIADDLLLQMPQFDRVLVVGALTALAISWAFSYLVTNCFFIRPIKMLQNFCHQVREGKYEDFIEVPNQGWDNADENEFISLMRDMRWMAHLIKIREKELQDTIAELNAAHYELKQANNQLLKMAVTDPLTGLFNRRHFFQQLEQEYMRLQRIPRTLAVIMLDIDHFKQVNDQYGHDIGDKVLEELATMFKGALRSSDLVARIGGEEFAILISDSDKDGILLAATRIRRALENHVFYNSKEEAFKVTCSLGVVMIDQPNLKSAEKLYEFADMALYAAKAGGRNRIYYYDKKEKGGPERVEEFKIWQNVGFEKRENG